MILNNKLLTILTTIFLVGCAENVVPESNTDEADNIPHNWLNPPDYNLETKLINGDVKISNLDDSEFYEVRASKHYVAMLDLQDEPIILLKHAAGNYESEYYTGPHFKCNDDKQPYLVRAVYGHGGTGGFDIGTHEKSLFVEHSSLGRTTINNATALVACLSEMPEKVFVYHFIAE